jgi:hypothetical protein
MLEAMAGIGLIVASATAPAQGIEVGKHGGEGRFLQCGATAQEAC